MPNGAGWRQAAVLWRDQRDAGGRGRLSAVGGLFRDRLRWLDSRLAAAVLTVRREPPSLLGFIFHSLFRDRGEVGSRQVDAYQPVLVDEFRAFITYFQKVGYTFIAPSQIGRDLDPAGRYAVITFDDGYANNRLALPVMRELAAPATFFVSTNCTVQGKAYWWDVLYRRRIRQGVGPVAIAREQESLKRRPYDEIERYLVDSFGPGALDPAGDIDRPMNPAELRAFAADPLVTIGNHTADHAILTVLDDAEVRRQIRLCQTQIAEIIGRPTDVIAYPNGLHDERVVRIARDEGLRVGFAVARKRASLPVAPSSMMTLPRWLLSGGPGMVDQCVTARSDVRPLHSLRAFAS